jgi:hypothetical protein
MTQKTDSQRPTLAEKRATALRDNLKRRKDQLKQRETVSDANDTKTETEKP